MKQVEEGTRPDIMPDVIAGVLTVILLRPTVKFFDWAWSLIDTMF